MDLTESEFQDEIDETNVNEDGKMEKEQMYTAVPQSDKIWVEEVADRIGGSKAEAIRRIIMKANMYEEYKDDIFFD